MSTTTNLQLEKPDKNDYYDIQVQNNNMDKIDTAINNLSTTKAEKTAVEELKKSVSDGKTLVANAITGKGISTSKDATFQTMATNISAIETNPTLQAKTVALSTSSQTVKADSGYDGLSQVTVPAVGGNAVAGDVLSGKTFASGSGVSQSGTMVNNGAINQTLAINGTYTIPSGYHNGAGKVTQSISTKGAATYTPNDTTQTIAASQYLSGVQTITPVPTETKTVTAGTSATAVNRTSGKYMTAVTVNPTPSQTKTVTLTSSPLTVTPDSGFLLSSVTVSANLGRRYATGTVASRTQYSLNLLEARINGDYKGVGDGLWVYYHDIALPFEPSILVFKYETGTGYWRKGIQYGSLLDGRRTDIVVASTTGSEFELTFTSTNNTAVGWVNATSARIPMLTHYSTNLQSMTWEAWE